MAKRLKSAAEIERYRRGAGIIHCVLVVWLWAILCYANRQFAGLDFPGFWVAGRIDPAHLYNAEVFQSFGRELLKPQHIDYINVYSRPAVFSLPLRLWMQQPYEQAFVTWIAVQVVASLAFLFLVWRVYRPDPRVMAALLLLWPAVSAVITGHDVAMLGCLMMAGLLALESGRQVLAGVLWGLCLYKFNLALCLPLLLLWHQKWRATTAFAVTGAVLALASAAIASPMEYVTLLGRLHEVSADYRVVQVNSLRGITAKLGVGPAYPWLAVAAWAAALWVISKVNLSRGIAVGVFTSLITAYHVGEYDYTLLWIPVGLMLAQGGWFSRTLAAVALCWLVGIVVDRALIIPCYVAIWAAFLAMLLRQTQTHSRPAAEAALGEPLPEA